MYRNGFGITTNNGWYAVKPNQTKFKHFDLVSLFNGIPTFVDYLMPKTYLSVNAVALQEFKLAYYDVWNIQRTFLNLKTSSPGLVRKWSYGDF